MPRRINKTKRGNVRRGYGRQLALSRISVPFRTYFTINNTSGIGYNIMSVPLTSTGTWSPLKLQNMSALFQYYKFKNLVLELYPAASVTQDQIDFGYATQQTAAPTTRAQLAELPWSGTYCPVVETVPKKFRVNLQHGNNQLKRFDTILGTSGDPNLQLQGTLYFGINRLNFNSQFDVYVSGVCELSAFVDSGIPSLNKNPQDDEKVLESDSPLVVDPIPPPAQVGFCQRRPPRVIVEQPSGLPAKPRLG